MWEETKKKETTSEVICAITHLRDSLSPTIFISAKMEHGRDLKMKL
jgi:hypothetical protein